MKKYAGLFLTFSFLASTPVWALRPVVHYHDLIAGEPEAGYRNGSFESAQFSGPQGLAFNEDGTRLFVADKNNNCIRVIFRDDNNRVETLTGSPQPGHLNGSLQNAAFQWPEALAYIGQDRLVVYDSGNHLLRLIDLKNGQVSDLAGNGQSGETDGKALQASLGDIWNILFFPTENAVYFSEPISDRLRKLDLKTGIVSTVLLNNSKILSPGPLCLYKNALCVTDWQTSNAYQLGRQNTDFQLVGNFDSGAHAIVLATASSDQYLYGLQQGKRNSWVRLPNVSKVDLLSVWAKVIPVDKFLCFPDVEGVAFISDPREDRKFFVTGGLMPYVISLKDYNFSILDPGKLNQQKLSDFEYPLKKPARTYRILLVGNSMTFSFSGRDYVDNTFFKRNLNLPKQLELILNTRGAMENAPLNYEVLDIGHGEGEVNLSSYFWPRYDVPGLVKKFDIDLVLYIMPTMSTDSYSAYFQQPITKEGIPAETIDSEYMLKPWDQKIPPGAAQDFFTRCLDYKWVKPVSASQLKFEDTHLTLSNPAVRDDVVELLSRPIKRLADQLKTMKTSANQPVRYQMVLIYRDDTQGLLETYRDFWQRMAQKDDFPLLDMVGDFLAFRTTYEDMYSYTDFHYNSDGVQIFSYLLSQELISRHLIPFS